MNKYYYSYSYDLTKWILANGIKYVDKGIHHVTGKHYYVFERVEELSNLLQQYHDNKPKK